MLMGTAAGNELKKPEQEMKFVEDMTDEERARVLQEKTGIVIPAGLENLGNTCYMNSVMQSLKRVNELREGLQDFELADNNSGMVANQDVQLTSAARELMKDLSSKGAAFAPYTFVSTMKRVFPMFDERDDKGNPKQQDADEALNLFLTSFQQAFAYAKKPGEDAEMEEEGVKTNPIERLFQIDLETLTTNKECEDEPPQLSSENAMKLRCYIDNNNNPINNLDEGLEIGLSG